MSSKNILKFVWQVEREKILQGFITNLENEDADDIFERSDGELENGGGGSEENVDIENIDVNIESNSIEIIEKPVDNKTNRNNNCHANVNIDKIRNNYHSDKDSDIKIQKKTNEKNFDLVFQKEEEKCSY